MTTLRGTTLEIALSWALPSDLFSTFRLNRRSLTRTMSRWRRACCRLQAHYHNFQWRQPPWLGQLWGQSLSTTPSARRNASSPSSAFWRETRGICGDKSASSTGYWHLWSPQFSWGCPISSNVALLFGYWTWYWHLVSRVMRTSIIVFSSFGIGHQSSYKLAIRSKQKLTIISR